MPRVSEAYAEQRRTQILRAATKCIARNGFDRTTMKQICAECGLSPGSVYTWFPSKQSIIKEMARRRLQAFEGALGAARESPLYGVRFYLETVRQGATNPEVGWMNLHLLAAASRDWFARDVMRSVTREGLQVLKTAFRRLRRGSRQSADARARLLQAAAFGILIQALVDPEGERGDFALAEKLLTP